ncbi:MAG: phosphoglyceromutase [Bacteroidetes bacterium]|nr:phosphoglyceromutase [Bacteroidota bacterium]
MKINLSFFFLLAFTVPVFCQKTENLIIVTYDGLRWQEVFTGVDSTLMNSKDYNQHKAQMEKEFWAETPEQRREKLFPFFWKTVAKQGQMHGNRNLGSFVNNANPHWFSYPGYNEIFTGYPDSLVNSNDKIENRHENVLEFIAKQKGFEGKVAAFSSWDVFPYILNEKRSNILVNAGNEDLTQGTINDDIRLLNQLQHEAPKLIDGIRWDFLTYRFAFEYLKANHPRVLYISLDETDDFAHEGRYDFYINAAHETDRRLGELWQYLQTDPFYAGKTTMFFTTDHGRGDADKKTWRDHGSKIPDCSGIWFAAIGPGIQASGESKVKEQFWQKQFAQTFAGLLGFDFKAAHPIAEAVLLKK